MPTITFANEHRSIDVLPGTNLRKAALKAGVQLYSPLARVFHVNLELGPVALHSTSDVVEVLEAKGIPARNEAEEALVAGRFVKRKVAPNLRLASQITVNGDITVRAMPKREVDVEATKAHIGFMAVVGGFVLFVLLLFLILGLDLMKRI